MTIRPAGPADAAQLATLLADYLAERFPAHPGTPAPVLERDVLSGAVGQRVLVAVQGPELAGFLAWDRVYDLHWGVPGMLIADLFVAPRHRGARGVALRLLTAACADGRRVHAARFVRGQAYDRGSPTGRLYERLAVGHASAECHCGGRAFRTLAELADLPLREQVATLPPRAWNFEP